MSNDKREARLIYSEGVPAGYEVWRVFDDTAGVFELFASADCDDYIGCADTPGEAVQLAARWVRERRAEA